MIAEAKALGAISVVNAIACGKGATVAVNLPTVAKVQVEEGRGRWRTSLNGRQPLSSLAEQTVRRAIRMLGRDPARFSGSIETTTSAPIGVGLKTSSSSSVAITLATFAAFGRRSYEVRDVLDCSVSSSLASRVSVTGALDDAASCLLGGANFSDNTSKRILHSVRLGGPLAVLIKVPKGRSRRDSVGPVHVRRFSSIAEWVFKVGKDGKIWKAMTLNGLLYSSIYGYRPDDALQALHAGAVGAGLSGTGPAVAAVFDDSGDPDELEKVWAKDSASVIKTETSDRGATVG